MTGQELKAKIVKVGKTQKEIADLLGLSQQSFNQMLSASDVKTSLLERIAQALNVPISFFYGECSGGHSAIANGASSIAVNNNSGHIAAGDVSTLRERVAMLERLLEEKERTIKILMNK